MICVAKARRCGRSELVIDIGSKDTEVLCRAIPYLLGSLDIEPVLLHGDLWVSRQDAYTTA